MKNQFRKARCLFLILLMTGAGFGCTSNQDAAVNTYNNEKEESEQAQNILSQDEQEPESGSQETDNQESSEQEETEEQYTPERQQQKNRENFLEAAEKQEIAGKEAETFLQTLEDDNIFQNGAMTLTGLVIDDIDGNGKNDMLVMTMDAEPYISPYGNGSLWIYMNEDEPYCFSEEEIPYQGWFDAFWADVDNDGNVEIVFSAQGTGCGAAGDSYETVFKYENHRIKQMQLPTDYADSYDYEIGIDVIQQPEADTYSAYCSYFDEEIFFHAENAGVWNLPSEAQLVGSNARGFYDLCVTEYEGKNVLQASEYLSAEGGVAHYVGTAKFLITWEEDGTPKIIKWWVEGESDS